MNTLEYPLNPQTISQRFGEDNSKHLSRSNYYEVFDKKHPGVDFSVKVGTKVLVSCDGIVVRNEFHKGMGNVVGTRNGNIVILYAHLSKSFVHLGQIIKQGNCLGLSGDTGSACDVPHLHFEMRDISKPFLKEMIFEPIFEKEIKQHKDQFKYQINNQNTSKNWEFLSVRYFGNDSFWETISKANDSLNQNPSLELPEKVEVIIPNYS